MCRWPAGSSNEGKARSLFFSTDVSALRHQYLENPVLHQRSDETRVVVSEPLGDLVGAWNEVPESSYGVIQQGVFFTSAAVLQCLETFNAHRGPGGGHRQRLHLLAFEPRRIDWWSSVLQLVGTLMFNINTFRAMQTGLEQPSYDRLVWRPDAIGSACFLVSGYLAYVEVCGGPACRPRRSLEWRIAAVNLGGCVAFGISAVASYVLPATGDVLALAAANSFTALGALCFLVGAVLLLPESATAASAAPPSP